MVKPSSILRLFHGVILGPPGSGKGTISQRIIKNFGFKHLPSGDLLRSHIYKKTAIGLESKRYIDKGSLVPDSLILSLINEELKKIENFNWLLDGFPRTVTQAEHLSKYIKITAVVNLDVPNEVIIERIKNRWIHSASGRIYNTQFNPPKNEGFDDVTGEALNQRDDDKPEVVKNRLISYQEMTKPVLEYYRNLNLLKEFKGKETNEIWPQVQKYLESYDGKY